MVKIGTEIEISASHKLNLPYESKCLATHGHNYKIYIELESDTLNPEGMIVDFSAVKKLVNEWDHTSLNDHIDFADINPTAENMASILAIKLKNLRYGIYKVKVRIYETERNWAEVEV